LNLALHVFVLRANIDKHEVLAFLDQPFGQLFDADAILLASRGLRDIRKSYPGVGFGRLSACSDYRRKRNQQDRIQSYCHMPLVRCV